MKKTKTFVLWLFLILITSMVVLFCPACNKDDADSTYKITLDKQGGLGGTNYVNVKIDSDMPKANAPTKSGYIFAGYYSKTEGTGEQYYNSQMKSSKKWNIKSNATLFAYWINENNLDSTNETFTVTLDKQGGVGGSSIVKAIYNKPMPSASMPTRLNYTFGGYFTEPDGKGVAYYASNMASLRSWDKQSNGTLYAYWISNYDEITMTTYNYKQYFIIERSCQGAGVGESNYFPVYVHYRINLKYGITIGENTSIIFTFQDNMIFTSVNITWSNSTFGASATSSKVYLMESAIKKTTATPISVSGKLYVKH